MCSLEVAWFSCFDNGFNFEDPKLVQSKSFHMNQPQMYNAKLLYLMNERSAHTWQSSSSDQIWCMCVCTSRRGGDPKSKTYVSRCQNFVAWNGKGSAGLELAFWMHLRLNVSSFRCEFVVQNDELYIAGVRNKCLSWVSLVILWVQFLGGQSRWNCVACKWIRYFLVGIWIGRKTVERHLCWV